MSTKETKETKKGCFNCNYPKSIFEIYPICTECKHYSNWLVRSVISKELNMSTNKKSCSDCINLTKSENCTQCDPKEHSNWHAKIEDSMMNMTNENSEETVFPIIHPQPISQELNDNIQKLNTLQQHRLELYAELLKPKDTVWDAGPIVKQLMSEIQFITQEYNNLLKSL